MPKGPLWLGEPKVRTFKKQLTAAAHICSGCCRPVCTRCPVSLCLASKSEKETQVLGVTLLYTPTGSNSPHISPASSELQIGKDSFFAERKFVYRGGGWVGASCGGKELRNQVCCEQLVGGLSCFGHFGCSLDPSGFWVRCLSSPSVMS